MKVESVINEPLVSVVVPLYEGGKFIHSTLESILAQSYDNYEILVVDDGSSDDGPSQVRELSKKFPGRIQLLSHPDHGNHGIAASRNLAIRAARGMLVAFIDQDDLWLPDKLRKQVDWFKRFPEAGFVYSKSRFVDEKGLDVRHRGVYATFGQGTPGLLVSLFPKIIKEDCVPNLTVLVRKSCLELVGLLDEGPRYEHEDWLLWSKVTFYFKVVFIPEVLAEWRVHTNNFSASILETGKLRLAEEHYTIALFTFLMQQQGVSLEEVRKFFRRRVWLFLLRARSWGASASEIGVHADNLLFAFSSERFLIQLVRYVALLFPRKPALALRRIRRRVVGM